MSEGVENINNITKLTSKKKICVYDSGNTVKDLEMPAYYPLFVNDDESEHCSVKNHFILSTPIIFDCRDASTLENLVHQITTEPKNLLTHLQRIYFCYSNHKSEQLYAALIDLFTILAGKGAALAQRMIYGTCSGISKAHQAALEKYLRADNLNELPGNQYTVLSHSLLGTTQLVDKDKNTAAQHDHLVLAHNFIEFSQLDSAIEVLEQGVQKEPDRKEMQELLLELYKSTHDLSRFRFMYELALQNNLKIIAGWKQLDVYFNEHT